MPTLSYEKQEVIAHEKELFFDSLGSSNILNRRLLDNVVEEIDETIAIAIREALFRTHSYVFGSGSGVMSKASLLVDDIEYTISTDSQDALYEKIFHIYIVPHVVDANPPEMVSISRQIPEKGRFRKVEVAYPKSILRVDENFILTLSISLFNIGYDWLNTALIRAIKELTKNLNVEIYDFMHRMVQRHELLEGFIFSALTTDRGNKDKDFVLLDEAATRSLIQLAEKSEFIIDNSPARLVSDMVFDVIPIEESAIVDVVKSETKKDINLVNTDRYSSNEFAKTLRAVWGDTVCSYPILGEGRYLMVAFYPKKNDQHISKYLKLHQKALADIAKKNIKEIDKTLKMLEKVNGKEMLLFGARFIGELLAPILGLNPNPKN